MKTKTTLILLGIVLALGLWIKFYESQGPNTAEAKRRSGNVLNFDRDHLEGIEIQNGDETTTLRRVAGKWLLDAPIKDQADRPAVENLIADLESWQNDTTITAKEIGADKNRLSEYDLVRPKLRLKLIGQNMPPQILFGKDTALEGRMYVRFENAPDTFVASQKIKTQIAKKPEEFRDRKLTEITTAQVTRLILKTPAGELEVQKQGDAWEIVKPLRARADNQKIGDLIAQVTSARIEQFVADDRGDLRPYGLNEARGAITLFTADDQQGRTLQIGASPEKQKDQIYVRFSARSFIYTLPKTIESILSLKPADLRDRHLVRIETNVLDRITIDAPGKTKTILARKEQNWTIANLDNRPANPDEVTRLLETIKNEQVSKFVEDVASDLPKYGLDQPQLRITFSSFASENTAESKAGEEPFASVAFGRTEGDDVYARVGEEPFVVTVPRAIVGDIPSDPVQWQELALFKFKPADVHRLAVMTDRETSVTRGANGDWIHDSGGEAIDPARVESLLNSLAKLRAVRWVGGALPAQAFDKAQITITFTTSPDDKVTHKLIVGGPAGSGMWYGRLEERPGVFVLSNPDFNALRSPFLVEPTSTPPIAPAASPSIAPR
ncbi:MAG: DUF4340 domain-containing protein [Chthoniobacterales bacterium]